jgi:two-component system, sensor histidine kinase YesM
MRKNTKRFQYKRFLNYAALSFLPLIALCLLLVNQFYDWALYIAKQNASAMLDKNVMLIDSEFSSLATSIFMFDSDPELHNLFAGVDLSKTNYQTTSISRDLEDVFNRYFFDVSDMVSICLITPFRTFLYFDRLPLPHTNDTSSVVYKSLEKSDGLIHWFPTYNRAEDVQQTKFAGSKLKDYTTFTIGKRLDLTYYKYDVPRILPDGSTHPVLLIHYSLKYFDTILSGERLLSDTEYVIYSSRGEIIYSSLPELPIAVTDMPKPTKLLNISRLKGKDGKSYLLCNRTLSSGSSWTVASLTRLDNAYSFFGNQLMLFFLAVLLATALYTSVMIYLSMRSFSKPFSMLTGAFTQTAQGDFNARISSKSYPDFQQIFDSYNRMNEQITRLIHENYEIKLNEKNLELQVINLQFNPHFIYNTLNTISLLALTHQEKDISDMVHALAFMMRYSIKTTQGLVLLAEDIQYINAYVSLMQLRFEDKFLFEWDVEEPVLSRFVPKFLLQPFIENAILHGFALQEKQYSLTIKARLQGEDIIFEITDTGCGMTLEEEQRIWSKESTSLGIRNTNERIKMYYGEEYGVAIQSTPREGTAVTIRIGRNVRSAQTEPKLEE